MKPTRSNLVAQAVGRAREIRTQPYWDTILTGTAATTLTFFQNISPAAAALAAGGTNMQVAGQFPAPRQFLVKGISIFYTASVAATMNADANILGNGTVTLTISDKEYLRLLGWMAPAAGGVENYGILTATVMFAKNGQSLQYNYFHVNPAILIPMQQNFKVTYQISAVTTTTPVTCVLWGTEERAVQ